MADTRSPGWYPAPDGNGQQWWNGVGWSETRRGGTNPVTSPPPPAPIAASLPVAQTTAPPPVYSATNPPPLRPDPYARPPGVATSARTIDASVNRNAMIGFILGIIALFFNLLFMLAPLAIVFSIMGLSRARQLRAQGATNTLALFAWIGLVLGVISAVAGLVQIVVFIVSIASFDVDVSAMFPASGILPWVLNR